MRPVDWIKIAAITAIIPIIIVSCKPKVQPLLTSHDISKAINAMSATMVQDVTNPPLAARFFAYICLSGYEIVAQNDPKFKSMKGRLNNYPNIEKPPAMAGYDFRLSAIISMLKTSEKLQPSGALIMKAYETEFLDSCRKIGFDDQTITASVQYASFIAGKILAYAKTDGYIKTSNFKRYTPSGKIGTWLPTPPAYFQPVEPYFATIRPLTLDNSSQFRPKAPAQFSTDHNSAFYKIAFSLYKGGGSDLTPRQKTIAGFWDCNPFAVTNNGHLMIAVKKMSPGAHWMVITGIACNHNNIPFSKAMFIHTAVAIGLTDGFISCWDAKYTYNRVRPETAIRQYIDPNWKPLLQSPPFPEYTSGHSVISSAAAVILSRYLGNNFKFTDSAEVHFGVAPRHFNSFTQAANEAAVSRFYGGIHFIDSVNDGVAEGDSVGHWVVSKLDGITQ